MPLRSAILALALALIAAAVLPARAAYEWRGDVAGRGNRALVRVYLENPPGHAGFAGWAHVTAQTESDAHGAPALNAYYSIDDGASWSKLGEITRDGDRAARLDLAHFAQTGTSQTLLVAIEHHTKPNDADPAKRIYRIEVYRSLDGGVTWSYDSTVALQNGGWRGYWAPHLVRRPGDNQLQCYFDDEVYPGTVGRDGQQCLRSKVYTAASHSWGSPTVVAFQDGMSRDGMPTVVALGGSGAATRLLCLFESPEVDPPTNPTRVVSVTSTDGGATWGDRRVVYQPLHRGYHALCPYVTTDARGQYVIVFSTDEDRWPEPPGDNRDPATLRTDVKYLVSDDGEHWSSAGYLARYADYASINLLWPGVARGRDEGGAALVCQFDRLFTDVRVRQGFVATGPGEASGASAPFTASHRADGAIDLGFTPACGAIDHVAYWGTTPLVAQPAWTGAACGLGTAGHATIDPGVPPSGQARYFVVAGQSAAAEGSYGRDSAGRERPAAAGLTACSRPQDLDGPCP